MSRIWICKKQVCIFQSQAKIKGFLSPSPIEICCRSSHSSRLSYSNIWQMMIIPLGNITAPKGSIIAPPGTEVQVSLGWNRGSLPLTVHSHRRQEGQNIKQVTPQLDYLLRTEWNYSHWSWGWTFQVFSDVRMLHYSFSNKTQLITSFGVLFFLCDRDKHFKTSKDFSGVDLAEVQGFYDKISKKPKVLQEVRIRFKDSHYADTEELWICAWNLGISWQPNS